MADATSAQDFGNQRWVLVCEDSPELQTVIVDEQFQGGSALDNDVLHALQLMPMSARRYVFVALLGRTYKTFDNMMAFSRSVNVVVNLNDLPHLPAILRKGITENNEFYRTFREVLAEVGKR
jgi:hypothetical protein